MKRKRLVILLFLGAVVAGGAFVWTTRTTNDERAAAPPPPTARASEPQRSLNRRPSNTTQPPQTTQVAVDADPVGTLRVEGQVLDEQDTPVAGATVYLNSRPPKTATSADDGSFSFDKVVARRYVLSARKDELVGGPVVHELTAHSDPAIVRVSRGGLIEVTVVTQDDLPIAGANIGMQGMSDITVTTDDKGAATLRGAPPGWLMLVTRASGFGTARTPLRVPSSPTIPLTARVVLAPGSKLSGWVVNPKGKPIGNARVIARGSNAPFATIDVLADGIRTDDKGAFTVPGLAYGTYQLMAFHDEYAPGTSDHVAVSARAHAAVTIRLRNGGSVSGQVVDSSGFAASWAEVTLTTDPGTRGQWGGGSQRQVVADQDGLFHMSGLARGKVQLHAATSEASSEVAEADLATTQVIKDVVLTLTVAGKIAGTVVDEAGEPVPEAQVMAHIDFWAGRNTKVPQVRGPSFATTDGGGAFELRGLAPGDYLVRASRGLVTDQRWLAEPVRARPGAVDIRLVLPQDGSVRGKIQLVSGAAPPLAIVSVGPTVGVPVQSGALEIDRVPPGTYDITILGSSFPRKIVRGVEVKPGDVTNIGVITLEAGRNVSGRVIDANKRVVAGATVVLANQLVGDGANLVTSLDEQSELAMGLRRSTTADDGTFAFGGVVGEELAVAAEHTNHGRSLPVEVAKSNSDAQVTLVIQPLGALRGKVRINGQPAPDVSVLLASPHTSKYVRATRSGLDGGYFVERIAVGTYKVTALLGGAVGAAQMVGEEITIESDKTAQLDLEILQGTVELSVSVRGKDGAKVDAAQVFLFGNSTAAAKTGGELNKLFLAASQTGDARMAFSNGGTPAVFSGAKPGDKSLCVIPITGDMNDPQFAQRVQQNAMTLAVYCYPHTVVTSPTSQERTIEVPAMKPLPQ